VRPSAPFGYLVGSLVTALSLAIACGGLAPEEISRRNTPIINGEKCDELRHPAAVAIMVEGNVVIPQFGVDVPLRTVMCTGTLIAPDVVLTAAHCVYPDLLTGGFGTVEDAKFYVSFAADLSKFANPGAGMQGALPPLPSDAVAAVKTVPHKKFTIDGLRNFRGGVNDNLHDIAVIFLEKKVERVKPAIVITKDEAEQLAVGSKVEIAGWGQQNAARQNPFAPPTAGAVGIKVCAVTAVNEVGRYEMQIGNGPETQRKCHGDSGGPSFFNVETTLEHSKRVVGITSHAYDQTDCQKGGVDTRVDAWLDWIDEQMTLGCSDGVRVWCDVDGIIPPEFYESKNQPEPEDGSQATNRSGCQLGGDSLGLGWAVLLGLLAVIRRRRSSRNRPHE
jgi:hypothetical protein